MSSWNNEEASTKLASTKHKAVFAVHVKEKIEFFVPLDANGSAKTRATVKNDFLLRALLFICSFTLTVQVKTQLFLCSLPSYRTFTTTPRWTDPLLRRASSRSCHPRAVGGEQQEFHTWRRAGVDWGQCWNCWPLPFLFVIWWAHSPFYQKVAKPLMSIDVERRIKPLKHDIITKKRNKLRDPKGVALYSASCLWEPPSPYEG